MNDALIQSYWPILLFMIIAFGLASLLTVLPMLFSIIKADKAKLAPYECGFETFGLPRKQFDIRFYLVSILFIIFDLEIAFLFPWAVALKKIGWFGFWSMMSFLFVLTVGFIYEWKRGALDWE